MTSQRKLLWVIGIVLILGSLAIPALAQGPGPQGGGLKPEGWWATVTAYQVAFTHFDPPWEPHYGAWFSSSALSCTNPHYLGPGGDAATCDYGCISTWNWWGSPPVVLLTPKSWLNWPWTTSGPRWTGSNYQADCFFW